MTTRNSINSSISTPVDIQIVHAASWPSGLTLNGLTLNSAHRTAGFFHGKSLSEIIPDDDFTRLDLFNTVGISEPELRTFMAKRLGVKDIGNNLEGKLTDLQSIYEESISFMERVLYLRIPLGLRTKKWNSVDEFMQAIADHTKPSIDSSKQKNGAYSIMFCAILKTMVVESDIYRNHKVDRLDHDLENLNNHLISQLGLREVKRKGKKKGEVEPKYTEYTCDGHRIKIASRAKTPDAIRLKEIYKRKYHSVEDFGDLLGVEIELDDSLSIDAQVHIISRIKQALYGKLKFQKVDESGSRIPVTLEVKGSVLTTQAIAELEASGEIKIKKKKHSAVSSLDFEDAKFTPAPATIKDKNGKRYSLNPEVRFVKSGNRNESGFASHDVMDLKRVLTANVRLFGAITLGNLSYILDKFPYENHDDGTPKTTTEIMKSKKAILGHLFYPPKLSNGAAASGPFLRILIATSTQTGEKKMYITTTNVLFTEDEKYSLVDIYDQYPQPDTDYNSQVVLDKIFLAIDKILGAKSARQSRLMKE